ncbi:MAG: PspA/IM30 family protein [Fibrobacteria bacterium]|nr:PspA/IM30 family protein [Fibrobacteria bacterium]
MGFFSRLFRLGSASANEMLDNLESGKEVELTKGDIRALKKDEAKVLEGLAEIKASIVSLERDIKAARTRKDSYENNAMALLQKDPEDASGLARQNAIEVEAEEEKIYTLHEQLVQQTKLEMETRENLRTIQQAIRSADNDLKLMSSMSAAKRSADKARTGLAGLGKSNALDRIQDRKKKLMHEMEKSRALQEISQEGSPQALEDATRKALANNAGANKLEELRKKLEAPK